MANGAGFPVGRSYKAAPTRSGNPRKALVAALHQANALTGAGEVNAAANRVAAGPLATKQHAADLGTLGSFAIPAGKIGALGKRLGIVPWVAGRPWFHGSARAFEAFDPAKANPHSLYGPGHYVTDDPTIASEYAGKGAGGMTGNQKVSRHPYGERLRDRVAVARKELEAQGLAPLGVRRVAPGDQHVVIDFMAKGYGPNVTRYSFEPDKVLDIRAPIDFESTSRLVRAIHDMPDWPGHPVVNWREAAARELEQLAANPRRDTPMAMNAVWHALENRLGAARTNEVIRRAGYDAIAYPGGKATGGRSHNALVVLNPAPLKRGGVPNPKYAGVPRPVR